MNFIIREAVFVETSDKDDDVLGIVETVSIDESIFGEAIILDKFFYSFRS